MNGKSNIPRYDWQRDDYKLRDYTYGDNGQVISSRIPKGRCFHCAKAFTQYIQDAYCGDCEISMAVGVDAIDLVRCSLKKPIQFEDEEMYRVTSNFKTATGKPVI